MRFFRLRWRSGPLLQDATTNFRVLGDVPEYDLYGLRLEDLPQGNSYLISTAQSSAAFVMGGLFGRPLIADAAGALDAVGSSTAEADVTVNAAGATNIAGEAMLAPTITLDNAGFETGDTTGWTALSGAGMTIKTATPKTGAYYVAVGQELQSASGQTHDIPSGLLTLVDLGLVEMRLAWGGASFGGDAGMPCLEFYDDVGGAGNLIGMHSAPRTVYPTIPAWANLETEAWVPSGARSVRIQLRGVRGGGTENSVYFDDISTRFLQRPNPHIQTQFMLGNETTGWTATTGDTANLVADTQGPWRNASGGLGYETLTHGTSDFVGYRDSAVPASQLDGVDDGLATCELTAQLIGAGTADSVRVWVEALDNVGASLGVVCQSGASAVTTSKSSTPVRALGAIPVGTRTLRYWQQMVRAAGTTDTAASRIGIMVEAPVTAVVAEAVFDAAASGSLSAVSEYTASSSFSANGLSSGAFAGGSIRAAVLSSTGIGTVLAVAEEPAVGSDFAAAAVAEFLATGTALVAAALEGAGVGAAVAEGAAINATALNAPSLTTAAFEGALTQGAVLAASGTAGGTFESSVIAAAQGSLTAAGALSSVATAVTQAVLDSSSAGQLDGAASAVTQAVLAGGGVGALDGAASAITQIVMSAAASGTLDGAGGATVDTVLSSTAQGSALWSGGASSDAALLATGTGALLARGGYGGTTDAGERRIELAAVSRVITLGAASDRVIYADTQDRTIYVAAEGRVTQ